MTTLPFSQRPTDNPRSGHPDDAMLEFASETGAPAKKQQKPSRVWRVVGAAVLMLLTAAAAWAFRANLAKPVVPDGSLRIESDPEGAAVEVDGALRGVTPLAISLPPGQHAVVVSLEAQKQEISATIAKGVQSVHHLRFTEPAKAANADVDRGRLQVLGDVSGATISVDGETRGTAPLTIDGLEPGEHQVVIQRAGKTQRRTVAVTAGATASLVITNAAVSAESGWMSAKASTPLLVYERGELIGTTEAERIMLPAGTHSLEFVADALGFRSRRNVTITPGQTTTTPITLPQVPANINAVPWAEVTIDGVASGQTPIANHLLTIGTHDVEFRHPSFGTKRTKFIVTIGEAAKVAVDMRTP